VDRYLFCFDSTELQPGEEARVLASVARLRPATAIEVHGYASVDGPAAYNLSLSCHRANRLMALLTGAGLPAVLFRTFKHGETSEMGAALEPNRAGLVVATFGCNCVEELVLHSSGAIEGTFGIDQYWPGVTPYWGSNTALGQFDIAGAGGAHTLGHKFQMVGRFSRSSSRVSPGDVSFQQMARLTVGAAAPGVVGAWFDDMDYVDAVVG